MCKTLDGDEPVPWNYFFGWGDPTLLPDYFTQVSNGKHKHVAELVYPFPGLVDNWYRLSKTEADYRDDPQGDIFDLQTFLEDCLARADDDPNIPWELIGGIRVVANFDYNWATGSPLYANLGGISRIWPVTLLPKFAWSNLHVVTHEMHHAEQGFGHSITWWDKRLNFFDIMSENVNLNSCDNKHPLYGCLPMGPSSFWTSRANWTTDDRVYFVDPEPSIQTFILESLHSGDNTGK